MSKFISKIVCGALCCCMAVVVCGSEIFSLQAEGKSFKAGYRGKALIINEGFTPGFAPERVYSEKIGRDLVLNAAGKSDNISYRREIATVDGGRELELTFQARVPAFNINSDQSADEDKKTPGSAYIYKKQKKDLIHFYVDVPFDLLKDTTFTAVIGRHGNPIIRKGKLPATRGDGLLAGESVRYISFAKNGLELAFDCNPSGVQDLYSSYTIGSLSGICRIEKIGNIVRFSMGTNASRNGGLHTGKMVIYQGSFKDFNQRHAQWKYSYYSELPAELRLVFGADKIGKGKVKAHLLPYNSKRTFGWLDKDNAAIKQYRPQGTLYSAVYGTGKSRFRADITRKGLYLVTVNTGTGSQAVKNMNLSLNGRELVKALAIAPATAHKIQIPMWIEDSKAEFEFSGDWAVSEIAFQMLLASTEDFSIRRGMWRSNIKEYPSAFYHNEYYAGEVVCKVHLSSYPLPEPGKELAAETRMPEITTGYGDMSKHRGRIFSAMIGSWGTSNAGTFTEFTDPGAAERNIKELKNNKINIVMFNGMLARHTFADAHKTRLHNEIGSYIRTGRKYDKNFIFIDHMDYSMLWNSDSGFRHLMEWNDRLQETVDGGLPGRARCMSNPLAVNEFYNTVLTHIIKTGLDGIMVDECAFMGETFCGCAACRKLFTAETGCQLPADELSKDLYNPRSPLWRAWEEWRRRKIGDFWVNLRKKVAEHRKDFIFIGYTTHYGLTADWAPNDLGSDLFNFARAWDMVGTEIMPRNIFANARAVNSLRKTFSLFGRDGRFPVFGLVYAQEWKIKYFGWAINNLNGQQTWETQFVPCPEGEVNYRTFTAENGNMDLRKARSAAKIALLFSETSRNLSGSIPGAGNYRQELLGTSQILSMLHIDHDIISEADLNAERLKKYDVLMLGNSAYLSDSKLAEIRKFAENGGIVTASYMAGVGDEFGRWRKNDFVAALLKWKPSKNPPVAAKAFSVALKDGKTLPLAKEMLYRRLPNLPAKAGDVVIMNKNGKKSPAVVRTAVGKGELIYFTGQYGYANCVNEYMVGKASTFKRDGNMELFQKTLLGDLLNSYRTWTPVDVPEGVFTASYWQDEKFVLHFLNAVNAGSEYGKVIKFTIGINDPFPALADMNFQLPFKARNIYAVSPDFAGRKALKFTVRNNVTHVTLPGELLKVYTIVYIEK